MNFPLETSTPGWPGFTCSMWNCIHTCADLFVSCGDQLRAEIQAMQQQLNEKDYELETHENEIKNYKKEIESHKRGAFEQYLEQKKSLDDLKSSVEKERCLPQFLTDPAIMKQRFDIFQKL